MKARLDIMTAAQLVGDAELGGYFPGGAQAVYAACRKGMPYVDMGRRVFERAAVRGWIDSRQRGDAVLSAKAREKVLLAETR